MNYNVSYTQLYGDTGDGDFSEEDVVKDKVKGPCSTCIAGAPKLQGHIGKCRIKMPTAKSIRREEKRKQNVKNCA